MFPVSNAIMLEEKRQVMQRIGILGDRIWTLAMPIRWEFLEETRHFNDWNDCGVYSDVIIEAAEEIKRQLNRLDEIEKKRK